jgi:hypothetical protein
MRPIHPSLRGVADGIATSDFLAFGAAPCCVLVDGQVRAGRSARTRSLTSRRAPEHGPPSRQFGPQNRGRWITSTEQEFEVSTHAGRTRIVPCTMREDPTMIPIRLVIAALVAAGLASAPAEAKKYKHVRHSVTPVQLPAQAASGMATTQSRAAYGTSGTSVGTVTAPSVGSYDWPSVGVTNAVPTWRNTSPPVR